MIANVMDLSSHFISACDEGNLAKVRACMELGVDVNTFSKDKKKSGPTFQYITTDGGNKVSRFDDCSGKGGPRAAGGPALPSRDQGQSCDPVWRTLGQAMDCSSSGQTNLSEPNIRLTTAGLLPRTPGYSPETLSGRGYRFQLPRRRRFLRLAALRVEQPAGGGGGSEEG